VAARAVECLQSISASPGTDDHKRKAEAAAAHHIATSQKLQLLMLRTQKLRDDLKQLSSDVTAWLHQALQLSPKSEVEIAMNAIEAKLSELVPERSMAFESKDGNPSDGTRSLSDDFPQDFSSIIQLIFRAHISCLLNRAICNDCPSSMHSPVIKALHLIRKQHVDAVARVMEKPLTFAVDSEELQQPFKFQGLDAVLLEAVEVVECMQVIVCEIFFMLMLVAFLCLLLHL
jgi:hypothetical protein